LQHRPRAEARNEKALEHFCSRACRLVRLAGFEPTTPWFVARDPLQKGNLFNDLEALTSAGLQPNAS